MICTIFRSELRSGSQGEIGGVQPARRTAPGQPEIYAPREF
jgi:hypothetical protein